MTDETEEKSLREEIESAMSEVSDTADDLNSLEVVTPKEVDPVIEPVETVKTIDAPVSLSAKAKEKWASLDREVQQEWVNREAEVHKGFTKFDEERNLGKSIKDVITPYMPIITAEGGEPIGAVRDLLNTAYQLRTAPASQKAQIVNQIIQQYGVDMSLVQEQEYVDPTVQQLQREIEQLKQMTNPQVIQNQLQERMEAATIQNEVTAFASDPANAHYEQVKPFMAAILGSGKANGLKEAYDMACRADPGIYSMLKAKELADEQAKRNEEIKAKRKAGVSVTGSPGVTVANNGAPDRSLREEIAHNLRALNS